MRLAFDAHVETVETFNVLADTGGRTDRTVVVGGYARPSRRRARASTTTDPAPPRSSRLRCRWPSWESSRSTGSASRSRSGEEDGLIGSDYYVAQLTKKEIKDHAVNLSVGRDRTSCDSSRLTVTPSEPRDRPAPTWWKTCSWTTSSRRVSRPSPPRSTDARLLRFIENGIPAGGLFTGAEDIKSAEQQAIYGGTAGDAYDPCYHAACDDIENINALVLRRRWWMPSPTRP